MGFHLTPIKIVVFHSKNGGFPWISHGFPHGFPMARRGRRDQPGAEGSAADREGLEAGAGGGGVGRGALTVSSWVERRMGYMG